MRPGLPIVCASLTLAPCGLAQQVPQSFPLPHPGFAPPPPGYPPWPTDLVPVIIQGDRPGLRYTIALARDGYPFAYCPYDCTLQLRPGEYWLRVHEAPGTLEGVRELTIDGPARARVTPRTEDDQSSGKTMGYIGVGLLAGGVVAMLWGVGEAVNGNDERATWLLVLGLGGVAAGSVLTPIGFVRAGRSAPVVEVEPLGRPKGFGRETR
jgi:hypothetical protein